MFAKILIANRGEIARRLFLACRELGVTPVAVFSDPDAGAAWLRDAGESYPLHGTTAAETYLNQEKILDVAAACGAEAIHPGYGFLSENPTFAAACANRGIKFIGPTAAAMEQLGSKASAREIARSAGVPVTPGVDGRDLTPAALLEAAEGIGFPVLIKASAGGGGKGMRIVRQPAAFAEALEAARREAASAFGDDHVILEKYLERIHHIEVQLLGDEHGQIVHLFERECSIQRRHQKIIEETPSPNLTPALREQICQAAVRFAAAAGYSSAGTVEFMYAREDGTDHFYLLEMNTRLQVEHPITEWVTGVDLAQWQIRIAAGEALGFTQADLSQRGHAIECRLYAEDPAQNFLPSIGTIHHYQRPSGPGIRVDDGIDSGSEVTPYYDPMLGKLIAGGAGREEALRRMERALRETAVLGVTTNLPYLQAILADPHFRRGETTTDFLERRLADWRPAAPADDLTLAAVGALELLFGRRGKRPAAGADQGAGAFDIWGSAEGWRNVRPTGSR